MPTEAGLVGTTTASEIGKAVVLPAGAKRMSRVIRMSTPKSKQASLPKTAALTNAQAEHAAWLKKRGIKVSKNTLRT